jgi:addiction module RelE/StbE family toxin
VSYTLLVPDSFLRQMKKFLRSHPDLRSRVEEILLGLEEDPCQPRLRLHPLRGKLEGYYAVSVTYSYRITLILRIAEREITLLDIGSHDDVYR